MFSKALIVATLTATLSVGASPAPIKAVERAADATPTVTLCTAVGFGGICVPIPANTGNCIDFLGGLTILNKEVSSAMIPPGFVCTFYSEFGCDTAGSSDSRDEIGLIGGSYPNFHAVPGINGQQDFNDMASSISCGPI
ncbi:hypothetical protein K435DRAFT_835915 [Dendrothele bispora CBS 962.96]|uniref:Hydrophobin n=1 Tax=Dendrothele bispora (strain CBS 962.96) TaxID=1314807 RepID=A0A4S8MKU9_DENBC|nr:hypothetical protein K435DRAFT_835915 [Dendrothele bispora CBS 962.96]